MNVSLSPEDGLGRMLHSFSSTAYEIADFTYDNLIKLGIIEKTSLNYNFLLWKTINLSELVYTHAKAIINFKIDSIMPTIA